MKLMSFIVAAGIVLYLGSGPQMKNKSKGSQDVVVAASVSAVNASSSVSKAVSPRSLDRDLFRGMTMQISYTASGIEPYLKQIDEIADLGANTVGISAAGYQEHAGSSGIMIDVRKCPTPEQFSKLIKRAKDRGMKVVLMPVLLMSNPRGTEWRGVIQPPDWDEWFSSYLEFIKYFAKIGLDNDAEALVVGAELVSTESFRSRWIKVINEVRRIYHGKLLYSANWDHYRQVSFWDKLDMIGMTTYHKLADTENPSVDVLLASWAKIKKDILGWQRKIGKPILFTEVGWCSQPGASIEAWNYYRHQESSEKGLEEQKRCYEAFIQTWRDEKAMAGAMWWEWTVDGSGPKDYMYTPKGKPAEQVLRAWYNEGKTVGK